METTGYHIVKLICSRLFDSKSLNIKYTLSSTFLIFVFKILVLYFENVITEKLKIFKTVSIYIIHCSPPFGSFGELYFG